MTMPKDKEATLGMDTKFSLPLVILIVTLVGSTIATNLQLAWMRSDMQTVWTVPHMALWAERFSSINPGHPTPSVENVDRVIRVIHPSDVANKTP